jgi:WhiB family redox-sensing transcriptional regulator
MTWQRYAACLGHDPELFFPIGEAGPARTQVDEAKAVCAGCPVRCLCLEWSLLAGINYGVWGGMSETERLALKRRNGASMNGHTYLAAGSRQ